MSVPLPSGTTFRLIWLCPNLQPGRSGVGDFARSLGQELAPLGWASTYHETKEARPPPSAIAPDTMHFWQFVPYGFGQRGILPRRFITDTAIMARAGVPSVVYLHELWLGIPRSEHFRGRLIGWLQRRRVLAWLRAVQPRLVLTSNEAYAAVLAREGWLAAVLPLPSNIPPVPMPDGRQPDPSRIIVSVFGAVHPQWRPESALMDLALHAQGAGRRLVVEHVGPLTGPSTQTWQRAAARCPGIEFVDHGLLPPEEVSHRLQLTDLALSTMPFNLLGKSGSFAAHRAHGLPVLVVRDDWWPRLPDFRRPDFGPAVQFWRPGFDWPSFLARKTAPHDTLPEIAARLHELLTPLVTAAPKAS